MRRRVQALCAGRGIQPPEKLFFDFSPLNLSQPEDQQRLRERIRDTLAPHTPEGAQGVSGGLVVLDVLARYLPGVDENAVSAVGPVFSLLRELAAESGASFPASPLGRTLRMPHPLGVLVVHHFNKSTAAVGRGGRMQRVRGSSDIAAAVDAALSVTLSGSRQHPRRTITPEKNRELPEEPPFDFSLETVGAPDASEGANAAAPGVPVGALVLRFSGPTPPAQTARQSTRARVFEILRAHSEGAAGLQGLTRREIEQKLASAGAGDQGGGALSAFALNRLFIELASEPGVVVWQAGRVKRYRWGGG